MASAARSSFFGSIHQLACQARPATRESTSLEFLFQSRIVLATMCSLIVPPSVNNSVAGSRQVTQNTTTSLSKALAAPHKMSCSKVTPATMQTCQRSYDKGISLIRARFRPGIWLFLPCIKQTARVMDMVQVLSTAIGSPGLLLRMQPLSSRSTLEPTTCRTWTSESKDITLASSPFQVASAC
jgi:hypothetical protein